MQLYYSADIAFVVSSFRAKSKLSPSSWLLTLDSGFLEVDLTCLESLLLAQYLFDIRPLQINFLFCFEF